uniref:Uncharacterized protein n=1 Tax=Mustela putorius furo TaxID=9669 RepID=M3Y878_MUSPF
FWVRSCDQARVWVHRKASANPGSEFTKPWKEPRCHSTDEWIMKIWYIYTMEYYASIRKDEYPTFVST